MKVVAYYTPEYAEVVQPLLESLDKWNVNHSVEMVTSRGSWVDNCAIKPEFIRRNLEESVEGILYVDADAEFMTPIEWEYFRTKTQILCPVIKYLDRDKWELISNTMYWPKTEDALRIADEWVALQRTSPGEWDQITLAEILNRNSDSWNRLPDYYAAIDFMDVHAPAIVQHQASRRMKF